MTDKSQTNAEKPKRGRPRKVNPELEAMRARVAELESKLEANRNPILDPTPLASETHAPGTYVVVGQDAQGKDIYAKTRWTRDAIEKRYVPVTWTPLRSMSINPHNVNWQVTAEVETTTPSIVKDIYDSVLKQEKEQANRYRPQTAQETMDIDARANADPGSKQWSRVTRMGYGLAIANDETQGQDPSAPMV